MEGRQERVEPLDRAYDLSSFGSEVEAVARGDRSIQQCLWKSGQMAAGFPSGFPPPDAQPTPPAQHALWGRTLLRSSPNSRDVGMRLAYSKNSPRS